MKSSYSLRKNLPLSFLRSFVYSVMVIFLVASCTETSDRIKLGGKNLEVFFNKSDNRIEALKFEDFEQSRKDTIWIPDSAQIKNNYSVILGNRQINFLPQKSVISDGFITFFYEDSLFAAEIRWEMKFEDATLIEFSIIPKVDLDKASIGISPLQVDPGDVQEVYCLPHSLPYFRKGSANFVPSGWISNEFTSNNTFSLITEKATLSLSVLPPVYRLENKLSQESVKDYMISFDYNGQQMPSAAIEQSAPSDTLKGTPTSLTALSHHLYAIKAGDTVERKFMLHVTPESTDYTTGKHIGQYMATVPYKKKGNSNALYTSSMNYLLENPFAFNESKKTGDNYWGSVHSQTGKPYGNGAAYYAMYGNSFSVAALSQFLKHNPAKDTHVKRWQGVKDFLTDSEVQNEDGSFWSMLLLLDGQHKYSDQAYREWVWTHASAWISYFLLEAYDISGDEELLNTAKEALAWLVNQQRADGSFPKYFDKGIESKDDQGDIGWNALAFLKASELGLNIGDSINAESLGQKGLKAVDWMIANLLEDKNFYGSFEDVGGVIDSYVPSNYARAAVKAYKFSKDKKYSSAAKSLLTTSLAWVTYDYNKLTGEADRFSWDKDSHWQPAYGHVESTVCYYACSYTLPMMYLAATEYAGIASATEKDLWVDVSRNVSHLSTFLSSIPESKSKNGMEWRLFPFLIFSEWGSSQTCWAVSNMLKNRFQLQFPEIEIKSDLTTTIAGDDLHFVMEGGAEPLCTVDAEVDYLLFTDKDKTLTYLALLAEGTNTKRKVQMSSEWLDSFMRTKEILVLSNANTDARIGSFTKKQLMDGVEVNVDNSILLKLF